MMKNNPLPSLILLPGLLCDEKLWENQVTALSDICSPKVIDLSNDDTIGGMASRVLASAPSHFALAGLSMGGYVAFEIMRQAPERVICLALIDTMASLDSPEKLAQRKGLMELSIKGRFMGVSPKLLSTLIHKDKLETPMAQEVVDMGRRLGRQAFMRQQQAIIDRLSSINTLNDIKVPTLIIVGEDDKLTPLNEAKLMANNIVNAELHVLPKCGHLPPMEQPEKTNALLRNWLINNA